MYFICTINNTRPPHPHYVRYTRYYTEYRLFLGETGSAFVHSSTTVELCIHPALRAVLDRPPLRHVSDVFLLPFAGTSIYSVFSVIYTRST